MLSFRRSRQTLDAILMVLVICTAIFFGVGLGLWSCKGRGKGKVVKVVKVSEGGI